MSSYADHQLHQQVYRVLGASAIVDHVPTSIKDIALMLGSWVRRRLSLVHARHRVLPARAELPQPVYDTIGVVAWSIRRGHSIGETIRNARYRTVGGHIQARQAAGDGYKQYQQRAMQKPPLEHLVNSLMRKIFELKLPFPVGRGRYSGKPTHELSRVSPRYKGRLYKIARALVYGTLVAIVIAVLFGIDAVYRHLFGGVMR